MYMRVTYLLSDEYVYHKYKVETIGLLLHICLQKSRASNSKFSCCPTFWRIVEYFQDHFTSILNIIFFWLR